MTAQDISISPYGQGADGNLERQLARAQEQVHQRDAEIERLKRELNLAERQAQQAGNATETLGRRDEQNQQIADLLRRCDQVLRRDAVAASRMRPFESAIDLIASSV